MSRLSENVAYWPLGFRVWHGPATAMPGAHRHDEVEIGVMSCGANVMLYGGRRLEIPAGQMTVFWGAIPHQTVETSGNPYVYSLTIPLSWALTWHLPNQLTQALLRGQVVLDRKPSHLMENVALLKRWTADLARKTAEDDEIVLLEIQARLRRLARDCVTDGNTHTPLAADGDTVARIAAYLGDHYREPFSSEALGHAVGLHPRSAMRLFHRACGTTLVEHLTFHRIAHAQRLLATTDAKVIDVASESGFPSLSRFYAAFRSVCGQTPNAFRQQVWQPRSR